MYLIWIKLDTVTAQTAVLCNPETPAGIGATAIHQLVEGQARVHELPHPAFEPGMNLIRGARVGLTSNSALARKRIVFREQAIRQIRLLDQRPARMKVAAAALSPEIRQGADHASLTTGASALND